jgi:hypothetical protein
MSRRAPDRIHDNGVPRFPQKPAALCQKCGSRESFLNSFASLFLLNVLKFCGTQSDPLPFGLLGTLDGYGEPES